MPSRTGISDDPEVSRIGESIVALVHFTVVVKVGIDKVTAFKPAIFTGSAIVDMVVHLGLVDRSRSSFCVIPEQALNVVSPDFSDVTSLNIAGQRFVRIVISGDLRLAVSK